MATVTLNIFIHPDCCRCSNKIQKLLCCIKERGEFKIEKIVYEKDKVVVTGPFDAEKLTCKLCCKAGKIIKKIDIQKPPAPTPTPAPPVEPKNPTKPVESKKPQNPEPSPAPYYPVPYYPVPHPAYYPPPMLNAPQTKPEQPKPDPPQLGLWASCSCPPPYCHCDEKKQRPACKCPPPYCHCCVVVCPPPCKPCPHVVINIWEEPYAIM
ncbi:hypothetical protein EJB05_09175, partial [Eragrostis curvula]